MAKILVVEDDAMIRDMLTRLLSCEGYTVITAEDGRQGLQRARTDRPALILMDIGLPYLNGWQVTHRIRSMPVTREIPIIALTAFAMKEDRERCFNMGCNAFESKPIDMPRLLKKIQGLIASSPSCA